MPVSFSTATSATQSDNFILNPNAEIDTAYWNLYNDSGRTVPASITDQDITYTAVAPGAGGNGIVVSYIFHASQSYLTPLVTVVSPVLVTVAWYNGPTIANNPTATQLKAAWDAVPGAVALATATITGVAGNRQYENGGVTLANGGDASPTNGTGGVVTGVTLTRNTVSPLIGVADFLLSKDAASRQGMGVSTDFEINNKDKGQPIQISFTYDGSAGMVFGTSSDIRVWIYDITNATLIQVVPKYTLVGPASTIVNFLAQFTASPTSVDYRLIFHIGTTNATAWNFNYDGVTASDILTPGAVTSAPSLVLGSQPISGAVTDHMVVMWRDAATQWVPATIAGSAIGVFGTDTTQLGFATNIVSGTADIYIRGELDGFSFGPFTGYDQYIDNTAGGISPLPSPFTDTYVVVGKAISSTVLNIQFDVHVDEISNSSGTPLKGGLLTNSGVNDGTGDTVLTVGANGNALIANSGSATGLAWLPPIVATTPFTFTLATRTLTIATATNAVAGVMSAADHALLHNALTIGTANGLSLSTQVLSLAAATDSVTGALTAADHTTYTGYAASIALKAPSANPTFTGTITTPLTASRAVVTGAAGVLAVATTTAAEIAFVSGVTSAIQTQLNTKAPAANPVFTGTIGTPLTASRNVVTDASGNLTVSTTTAAEVNFVSGVTSAIQTQLNLLAPLASPVFTGTPSLPTGTTGVTQTAGNSTTALATTAFVTTADNLKANLASPTFTGTPTLPTGTIGVTQTAGNSTTALATTAFVTTADNLKAPLASPTFTGDVNSSTGNVLISTIGKGLQIKTGTNSKLGSVTLVAGTATVANTSVTANSLIFLTEQTTGGTVGFIRVSAKTVGTSFVITSSNPLDTSVVAWMIVEVIP